MTRPSGTRSRSWAKCPWVRSGYALAVRRPRTIHIGASGLIFGFFGYLLLRGYFERSVSSVLVALLVAVLYGGALWGVLPGQPGEHVEIAGNQRRLGNQPDGEATVQEQRFEQLAG